MLSIQSFYSQIERANPAARRLLWVVTLTLTQPVPFWLLKKVWAGEVESPPLESLLLELTELELLQSEGEQVVYRFDPKVRESCLIWMNEHPAEKAQIEKIYGQWYATSAAHPLINALSEDVFFDETHPQSLRCAIKQIAIENYQGIIKTNMTAIPVDSQWLFLTGENGFGKTAILQAIAIGLLGKQDKNRILTAEDCQISIELKNNGDNQITHLGEPHQTHFVAYGSSRLQIQNQSAQNEISEKSTITYSLFNPDGILLNIEYELLLWYLTKNPKYDIVKATLLKLLPKMADIQIKHNSEVVYLEKEQKDSNEVYQSLPFEKLAAGYKSIIAMIGDMLIRFYQQQPLVVEPKELSGIVLIDELDLHFHPKLQRRWPLLLSDVFPKVQFIASTHSVMPLLAAPENSVFFKVTRNKSAGIQLEQLNIDIKNLLPNSLLTSPLFDLEGADIKPENNKNISDIRTEDT
jgi:AAA15 family ATPase/GTPase